MTGPAKTLRAAAIALLFVACLPAFLRADNVVVPPPVPGAPNTKVPVRKIHGVDADNHLILLNKPGLVTLVLGTNEDSQDAARAAGIAVYPFQGRPDFQLVVIVDLRDSIATWMPAVVLSQMRSNLDHEAVQLKPWFVRNGNNGNPRTSSHVIPDFGGTICPQLNWPDGSDDLRGILYGADGREIKRWSKIDDMPALARDIRAAIQPLIDAEAKSAGAAGASRAGGAKFMQTPSLHPPLLPDAPKSASDQN